MGKTGVEMEALTAVQVGLLTSYGRCETDCKLPTARILWIFAYQRIEQL